VTYRRISAEMRCWYPHTKTVLLTKVTSLSRIVQMLLRTGTTHLQLHRQWQRGTLEALLAELRGAGLEGTKIIQVVDPGEASAVHAIGATRDLVDFYLFDNYTGGQGTLVDEAKALEAKGLCGRVPVILAGGLTVANVQDRIRLIGPFGVDVQTGVEFRNTLGQPTKVKNPVQMARFIDSVKGRDYRSVALAAKWPESYHSVSLALKDVTSEQLESVVGDFLPTGLDRFHLDHSDGSFSPPTPPTLHNSVSSLFALAPNLPYDVHFLTIDHMIIPKVIAEFQASNPHLGVVFAHVQAEREPSMESLRVALREAESMGALPGVALEGSRSGIGCLEDVIPRVLDWGISNLCVVGPSGRAADSTYRHRISQVIGTLSGTHHSPPPRLWVDRDMNARRARLCGQLGVSNVIAGHYLLQARSRREAVDTLRSSLAGA